MIWLIVSIFCFVLAFINNDLYSKYGLKRYNYQMFLFFNLAVWFLGYASAYFVYS